MLAPLLIAALLQAGPAPEPGPAAPRSIAVLELRAVGVPQTLTDSAALLMPSAVRRATPSARVISGADLRAVLDLERQRQLLGCSDTGCIAELAGALGVDELVSGDLGKIGRSFVLALRRIDAKRSVSLGTSTRTFQSEDDLVQAMNEGIRELFPPTAEPPHPPSPPAEVTRSLDRAHEPPAHPTGAHPLLPRVALGAGGVVALASAAGVIYARVVQGHFDAQQAGMPAAGSPTVTRAEARTATAINTASLIALPLALVAVGYGVWGVTAAPAVQVAASLSGSGGAVAIGGSF